MPRLFALMSILAIELCTNGKQIRQETFCHFHFSLGKIGRGKDCNPATDLSEWMGGTEPENSLELFKNLQLKRYWVSSGSLWKVKRVKTRQRTRIVLVGKSSSTWDAPSEAFLLLPVVLTVSWVNNVQCRPGTCSCSAISEQHVPLQEGIRFPFMFTCCNSI